MGGLGMEGWSGGKDVWMEHGWMDGGRELGRGEWVEHRQMNQPPVWISASRMPL